MQVFEVPKDTGQLPEKIAEQVCGMHEKRCAQVMDVPSLSGAAC